MEKEEGEKSIAQQMRAVDSEYEAEMRALEEEERQATHSGVPPAGGRGVLSYLSLFEIKQEKGDDRERWEGGQRSGERGGGAHSPGQGARGSEERDTHTRATAMSPASITIERSRVMAKALAAPTRAPVSAHTPDPAATTARLPASAVATGVLTVGVDAGGGEREKGSGAGGGASVGGSQRVGGSLALSSSLQALMRARFTGKTSLVPCCCSMLQCVTV